MSSTPAAGIITALCMNYDDTALTRCNEQCDRWENTILERNVLEKHWGKSLDELSAPERGSFNLWLRVQFKDEDEDSAVIRFPCPGASMFREEKVLREVAVMRFLRDFTDLRVPRVFHHGTVGESPKGIGPFIIMEYIDHEGDFIDALNIPGRPRDARPMLDPDISQGRLEFVYGQMADIMLQVSKHSFTEIGCIDKANDDELRGRVGLLIWFIGRGLIGGFWRGGY